MVKVRELISLVGDTNATVLIRGESGTGKELVARSLRAVSARRERPFVKVNCAALPSDLLESEMFGFERGAFSGALQAKPGKFEFANHGTIFLDEIGDMPASLQAKLLHVLQDGQFSRLGGQGDVRVDVRIVAATNRHLEDAVASGHFREDLFFRLNVVCIAMPPLRDRREEIPLLVRHFLAKYSSRYNRPDIEIQPAMLEALMQYDWPGNVRELENVVQRIMILGPEGHDWTPVTLRGGDRRSAVIERRQNRQSVERVLAHSPQTRQAAAAAAPAAPAAAAASTAVPVAATAAPSESPSLKLVGRNAARAAERELMLRMLHRTRWNRKEAAGILGISYKAMLYKIKEHGLDDPVTDLDPPVPG
jgi:two-component system, NtrC family, response regulator AtoC